MSLKFNSLFNIFEIPISKMNFTVGMHVCVCVCVTLCKSGDTSCYSGKQCFNV